MLNSESTTRAQIPAEPITISCEIHKDEDVKLFCGNCNVLVCSECVVEQHAGHTFVSLKNKAGETRKNLPNIVKNLKSNTIPKVRETLKIIKRVLNERSQNGSTVINGINGQADELILEINKVRNKLIQEEEVRQLADTKKLEKFQNKMEDVLSKSDELVANCPYKIKTAKDSSVIKLGLDLDKEVPEMEKQIDKIPSVIRRIFVPGKRSTESVRHLLGQCMDKDQYRKDGYSDALEKKSNHVTVAKLEVLSKLRHNTETDEIFVISAQENQTALITTHGGRTMKNVDMTGRVNKTVTINTNIWDIAVTDGGGLLVTPNGGADGLPYRVKKVDSNCDIVTFVDMKPLQPRGICTTKAGHVYVGCIDEYDYNVTDKSTRTVVKLSSTGIVQQRYQYDNKGQRLFTLPLRLLENANGDIWVRDRTARYEGRIVVLQDGKLRFVYKGVQNDQLAYILHPCDLTTAGDGTMLISDARNDIIHVVDENGLLLRFLQAQNDVIVYPTAISLDRKNKHLWIGNKKGQVQILHFK